MTQDTSYGFRHVATIQDKNYNDITFTKACYYNRTWESYDYQSVIHKAIDKCVLIKNKTQVKNKVDKLASNEINKDLAFIGRIAKIGEIFTDNQKEQNDWKKRMLNAGLGNKGLSFPNDWDSLSEEEKQGRLDKVIELTQEDKTHS